jgi:indole-3-glycerol phosphate synthase
VILERILERRRARRLEAPWVPLETLRAQVDRLGPPRSLYAALRNRAHKPGLLPIGAIAEFKRRSPSAGPIRPGADAGPIAAEYARAAAAAITVLTEPEFFDGAIDHLQRARAACDLPILRKDFLFDERDLYEARLGGADAALLIVRVLTKEALAQLIAVGAAVGLELLVEAHDAKEVRTAVEAGARIVGINHRDLDTLTIDLSISDGVRSLVGSDVALVAESGLTSAEEIRAMVDRGMDGILVGETLMRAASPGARLRELLSCS